MKAPSKRQRDVLRAVARAVRKQGRPPSRAELLIDLGIRSDAALAEYIDRLCSKGLLTRALRKHRAIALTEEGRRFV